MNDAQNTFFMYLRAAESLADVSASRQLDDAIRSTRTVRHAPSIQAHTIQ